MKKYTINKKLSQLRCANTGQRGPCIELPEASRATIENTMALIEGLLGVSPAANVLAARAMEVYLRKLTLLLNEAAAIQGKERVSEGQLLNLNHCQCIHSRQSYDIPDLAFHLPKFL